MPPGLRLEPAWLCLPGAAGQGGVEKKGVRLFGAVSLFHESMSECVPWLLAVLALSYER